MATPEELSHSNGIHLSVDDLERLTKAFNLKQKRTAEEVGEDAGFNRTVEAAGCGIIVCG
jgi:hypothetical protein